MSLEISVKEARNVKLIKSALEKSGALNKNRKINKAVDGSFIIPTISFSNDEIVQLLNSLSIEHASYTIIRREAFQNEHDDPSDLKSFISSTLSSLPERTRSTLLSKIPKKYTLYPPLLLINNQDTFDSTEWKSYLSSIDSSQFFQDLLQLNCFKSHSVTHIAINKPIIETDIMRRPFNLIPIYGDFGPPLTESKLNSPTVRDFKDEFWCTVLQNGIYQTWAPKYTMFSRGNIKEKARILNQFQDVKDKVIVDLYAGIGYFTLSYLKLGAKHLFCFEINPWSIEGLIRGVEKNGYTYKVINSSETFQYDSNVNVFIFHESNEFAIERISSISFHLPISHINLGLLPSSKPSWPISIELLKLSSSKSLIIHIHENIAVDQLSQFMDQTCSELLQLSPDFDILMVEPIKLNKIKTFAPDVWHIVGDFKLIK